jgi:cytochrome c553
MVAFVRGLPTMSPQQYRALAEPNLSATAPPVTAGCTGCHGADGMGRGQPDIPLIAGQDAGYIAQALRQYRAGKRGSAVMQAAAAGLDDRGIQTLSAYYAGLEGLPRTPIAPLHPIAANGLPEVQLPACASCHAEGKSAPCIAGQRPEYLAERLRQWHGDDTVVDARKPRQPMAMIARRIPAEDIDELAKALSRSVR